jgi:hypothetical protein
MMDERVLGAEDLKQRTRRCPRRWQAAEFSLMDREEGGHEVGMSWAVCCLAVEHFIAYYNISDTHSLSGPTWHYAKSGSDGPGMAHSNPLTLVLFLTSLVQPDPLG